NYTGQSAQPLIGNGVALVGHRGTAFLALAEKFFHFQNLGARSEEHTSELQSLTNLVCRLLLEKKKNCCWPRDRVSPRTPTAVSDHVGRAQMTSHDAAACAAAMYTSGVTTCRTTRRAVANVQCR